MADYPNLNNQNINSSNIPNEKVLEKVPEYDPNPNTQPYPVSGPPVTYTSSPSHRNYNTHSYNQNQNYNSNQQYHQNYQLNNQPNNQGYDQGYGHGYRQQNYAPNDPNNPNYEIYNNGYSSRQKWIMMGLVFLVTCLICGSVILFRRWFKNQQRYPYH